jgi:urease accessory protein
VLHPCTGLDHLLALAAIGLLAARMGGQARLAIPLTFLATLAASAACGLAGMELAFTKLGIGASFVLTSLLVLNPPRRWPIAVTTLAGLFAVFHGQAHGAEAAGGISPAHFIAGLIISSAGVIFAAQVLANAWVDRLPIHHPRFR